MHIFIYSFLSFGFPCVRISWEMKDQSESSLSHVWWLSRNSIHCCQTFFRIPQRLFSSLRTNHWGTSQSPEAPREDKYYKSILKGEQCVYDTLFLRLWRKTTQFPDTMCHCCKVDIFLCFKHVCMWPIYEGQQPVSVGEEILLLQNVCMQACSGKHVKSCVHVCLHLCFSGASE